MDCIRHRVVTFCYVAGVSGTSDLTLDLRSITSECEILPDLARSLASAAAVTLDSVHGPRDDDAAVLRDADLVSSARIVRVAVSQQSRDSYADPDEATEEGAEAIAYLVASRALDRVVFARLPKKTGADWKMRRRSEIRSDAYERLECSGIASPRESLATRLRDKLDRFKKFPGPRGCAIVTDFSESPVRIAIGWQPV